METRLGPPPIAVFSLPLPFYLAFFNDSCTILCVTSKVYTELLLFLFYQVAVASDILLQNPSPVPLGGVAVFNCSTTTAGIIWSTTAVDSSQVHDSAVGNVLRSSQLLVPAITVNNNTNITCRTFEQQQHTTQLYIYG